jgi:xanthine dehydrogenase YagS FAD-binding subunit
VRLALGGVATKPWRARAAEQLLRDQPLDDTSATKAAEAAFEGAKPREFNAFKIAAGKAAVVRALLEAKTMRV